MEKRRPKKRKKEPFQRVDFKLCPECGEQVDRTLKFCSRCGLIFFTTPGKPVHDTRIAGRGQPDLKQSKGGARKSKRRTGKAGKISERSTRWKLCPECGEKVGKRERFCTSCGIIFYTRPAKPLRLSSDAKQKRPAAVVRDRSRYRRSYILAVLAALVILGFSNHPRVKILLGQVHRVNSPVTVSVETGYSRDPDFDLMIQLPLRPYGMTWNHGEFLFGNNENFLGFLKLTSQGTGYVAQKIPLRDAESFGTRPVFWNGDEMIGYRETGLFEFNKQQLFIVYDPDDFRVVKTHPAPSTIGGLAWDGSGYWTATRAEEPDPKADGFLYRLNHDLDVVTIWRSPSPDCRGLAWDGSYLWFLDGISGNLSKLNVRGSAMDTIRDYSTPVKSPSGIVFDGETIWVSDHELSRLYRLNPRILAKPEERRSQTARENANSSLPQPGLRTYRGSQNLPEHDLEVNEFSAQILTNILLASWKVHFGQKLFTGSKPTNSSPVPQATLTITIDGGELINPVARVFSANPGTNRAENVPLMDYVGSGTYRIGLFLYLEYTDENGRSRSITRSIPALHVTN